MKMLTIKQAAARVGVAPTTIYKWIRTLDQRDRRVRKAIAKRPRFGGSSTGFTYVIAEEFLRSRAWRPARHTNRSWIDATPVRQTPIATGDILAAVARLRDECPELDIHFEIRLK